MQKLKMSFFHLLESLFTCFLKDKTLHNHWDYAGFTVPYYNIPSNNRELQQRNRRQQDMKDYEKSRKNYEQRKKSGDYDANMEYNKEKAMDDIRRGEIFYIARGGGRQTGVNNLRTDPQL